MENISDESVDIFPGVLAIGVTTKWVDFPAVVARVVLTWEEQLDRVPSLVIHVFESRLS